MISIEYLLDLFLFLFPIYYIYFIDNNKLSFKQLIYYFGLKKIKFKELLKHIYVLVFFLFIISMFMGFIANFYNISDLGLVSDVISSLPISIVLYLFIVRVFLEEWFFRGFLVKKIGVIFSSIIFALGHLLYGSIIEVAGAFVLGVFLAKYYSNTKNLWPNVVAHCFYNGIVYILLLLSS